MADELEVESVAEAQPPAVETPAAVEAAPAAPGAADATLPDFSKMTAAEYMEAKQKFLEGDSQVLPGAEQATPPAEESAAAADPVDPEAAAAEEHDPYGQGYRPRLGKLPKLTQEAIQLVREKADEGEDIELAEAERRVKAKYGVTDGQPAAAAAAPARRSASEIQASINAMEAEMENAGGDMNVALVMKLNRDLRKAEGELQHAQAAEQETARAAAEEFDAARDRVRTDYPQLKDKASPLSIKFNQIFDQLEAEKSPILNGTEAQVSKAVVQLAAAELGIKPAGASAAAASPAATQRPAVGRKPPVMPASGALRTTVPASVAQQIQQRINGAKTFDEYEKLKTELLAKS